MISFLAATLRELLKKNPELTNFTFILPGKRAGAFLRQEISKVVSQPVFSPSVLSIEEFSENLSQLTTLDNTTTLFEFYSVYKEITPLDKAEDFETFSNWAQTLIHDFNEIDRYLIPQETIFNYLSEIQDVTHWSATPEKTEIVANYLEFWKKLPLYYRKLKENLLKKGVGYQGLVYRQAAENIKNFSVSNATSYVFLGFNALNKSEQTIIQEMLEKGSQIFWDIDEVHFNDAHHDASLFLREYAGNWPYYKDKPFQMVSNTFNTTKEIEVAAIPKNIGQAKYAGEILSKLDPEALSKTALVLGDESLLLPILNSLPQNIPALNITMGFPLQYSPFSSLFERYFEVLKSEEKDFYYKDITALLGNPVIQNATRGESSKVIFEIQQKNLLYLSREFIKGMFTKESQSLISLLFPDQKVTPKAALEQLQVLIFELKKKLTAGEETLQLEFLYQHHLVIEQLQDLVKKYTHFKSLNSLHHFYKELSSLQSLDFQGKPFQGLQIMGMLESRVLDFETVIVTSVDEGILPAGKSNNSFIPYDLKKTFGLPTYKEKDAVYTYHFYHLLQRSKNIHLLHNSSTEGQMGGEKSRFLLQLEIEQQTNHKLSKTIITPEVPKIDKHLREITKTPEIIEKIRSLAIKGFSPSALTTYIRNPLDFYRQYILNIRDKEEVEETVAHNTLGTVVHDTLEAFYSPLKGETLTKEHISNFQKRIDNEVKLQFEKNYSKVPLSRGKNLLIYEVAKRYVLNFLKMENKELESGKEIKIRQIETNLELNLEIVELDFPVKIRGKVDRVDFANGILRIIDYKTGKVEQNQLEIVDWNDLATDYNKYAKPFQVLMYATMLLENDPTSGVVEAGVISFKNLKSGFLKFQKKESARDRNKNSNIDETVIINFKEQLKKLIQEICNAEIPFLEKEIKAGYGNY